MLKSISQATHNAETYIIAPAAREEIVGERPQGAVFSRIGEDVDLEVALLLKGKIIVSG